MKTAYMAVSYICNQRCSFCPCTASEKRLDEPDLRLLEEIAKDLIVHSGIEHIVVSGGEPTLFKGFIEFIEFVCREEVKKITVLSTAEKFSNEDFTKEFVRRGNPKIIDVISTLHSQNVDEHETINGTKNSFWRTINGLLNLNRFGVKTTVKHCITKKNYKQLLDFYRFVDSTFPEDVDMQMCSIDYCGIPEEKYRTEMLAFPEIEPYFEEMFDCYMANDSQRKLYCIYMPLCSADPYYWDYFVKNAGSYDSYVSVSASSEYIYAGEQSDIGTYGVICRDCKVRSICPGTYKSAFDIYGDVIVRSCD